MARRPAGFTLVELLVALFVMALLAVLSWRGLDGMVRAQEQTRTRSAELHALQVGLSQWSTDLEALVQVPLMSPIEWNGRVLRLTRRSPAGEAIVVVGWARRTVGGTSRWMRWQSPPLTTRGQVDEAWQRADTWAQNQVEDPRDRAVSIAGLVDWQVFFFRSDAWTNPLSSDAPAQSSAAPGTSPRNLAGGRTQAAQVPEGVRVVLLLAPGQAISGELVRDWVRPTLGGGKS